MAKAIERARRQRQSRQAVRAKTKGSRVNAGDAMQLARSKALLRELQEMHRRVEGYATRGNVASMENLLGEKVRHLRARASGHPTLATQVDRIIAHELYVAFFRLNIILAMP